MHRADERLFVAPRGAARDYLDFRAKGRRRVGTDLNCAVNGTTVFQDVRVSTIEEAIFFNSLTLSIALVILALAYFVKPLATALAPRFNRESGYCGWIRPFLFTEVDDVHIDGRFLIGFLQLGLKFSIVGSCLACVLLPVYAYANPDNPFVRDDDWDNNFLKYTTSNIDPSSRWQMWIVVGAEYILVITFTYMVELELWNYVARRREHYVDRASGVFGPTTAQAQFSLMVEQIPQHICYEMLGVKSRFEELFTSVYSCRLQRDTRALHNILNARSWWDTCCCCCSWCQHFYNEGVHNMFHYERKAVKSLRKLQNMVLEGNEHVPPSTTAFVTFTSLADQVSAVQQVSLFHTRTDKAADFDDWVVQSAPEPRDVVWKNASIPFKVVTRRCRFVSLACFVLVLFWNIPLLGLQALMTESSLTWYFPTEVAWMKVHHPDFFNLLTGYLPIVTVQGLLFLLPYLLEWLSYGFEGRKRRSEIANVMLFRNFAFQIATLYLLAIGSSLWTSFDAIMERPFCAGEILGVTIPKVSVYFITFVIARIGMTLPMLLLRICGIYTGLRGLCSSEIDLTAPVYCWFGYEGTTIAMVLVLANMYAVIAPVIMPICAVYFAIASAFYRWLFKYVYTEEFDGAGYCFEALVDGSLVGLLLGTMTMAGITGINGYNTPEFVASWLLPVYIAIFYQKCRKYKLWAANMPLEDAIRIDRELGQKLSEDFQECLYDDPIMKVKYDAGIELSSSSSSSEDEFGLCMPAGPSRSEEDDSQ